MKYQKDSYSCGAAAVVNVARCFGKKVPEKIVQKLAFTTPAGTDEHGIISALRGLGFDGEGFEDENRASAIAKLSTQLKKGEPMIICIQNMQHWVTVIGTLGDGFVVFDPAKTQGNKRENGTHVLTASQISKTWQARNGKLYGVRCFKK